MLSDRYSAAFAYALALHREQLRKDTEIPYITHLMAVSAMVLEHGGTEDQAIAGLLHDGPEDAGGLSCLAEIRRRFGDHVADIVADCTDTFEDPKPAWQERKERYLASLGSKPATSLLVSLADKTHNAEAIVEDQRRMGNRIFDRFTGGLSGTLWYYGQLHIVLASRLSGPLADRLGRAVGQMTRSAT